MQESSSPRSTIFGLVSSLESLADRLADDRPSSPNCVAETSSSANGHTDLNSSHNDLCTSNLKTGVSFSAMALPSAVPSAQLLVSPPLDSSKRASDTPPTLDTSAVKHNIEKMMRSFSATAKQRESELIATAEQRELAFREIIAELQACIATSIHLCAHPPYACPQ